MVDFSADVILVEFRFNAAPGRQFADAGEVDRAGIRIGVARNASADEYVARTLTSAQLVRTAGDIAAGIDLLRNNQADIYATVTDTALAIANRLPGATLTPGVFNTVGFAVAIRKGRSSMARDRLAQIIREAKASGLLQQAIDQAGLRGVRVAPD
ncbi:MAG: transporter substrate-binding domain-containing protein [Vicinamibacterales bacterium]